jgi:hypothetical protein
VRLARVAARDQHRMPVFPDERLLLRGQRAIPSCSTLEWNVVAR